MLNQKWIKIIGFIFLALFFVFIVYKLLFYFDLKVEQKQINSNIEVLRLYEDELSKLEEGDIILRKGFGYMSHMVSQQFNDGTYDISHCAILKKEEGKWSVIQSLSSDVSDFNGVQQQELAKFLKQSKPNSVIVVRLKAPKTIRLKLAEFALELSRLKIPFDRYGNHKDASELYCSELIWYILFNKLEFLVPPKTKSEIKYIYFNMSSFCDEKNFEIIINKQVP